MHPQILSQIIAEKRIEREKLVLSGIKAKQARAGWMVLLHGRLLMCVVLKSDKKIRRIFVDEDGGGLEIEKDTVVNHIMLKSTYNKVKDAFTVVRQELAIKHFNL